MHVVIIGPDRGMADALTAAGATVTRIDGLGTADALADAGVADADLLLLTDPGEATAVPIAKEANPAITTVAYSRETVPEFVRGQLDLALDPALLDPEVVADELTRR